MKTLIILLIISGILFAYFVVNADKSIFVRGGEVTPIGTDIPKLILNKVKKVLPNLINNNSKQSAGGIIGSVQPGIDGMIKLGVDAIKNQVNSVKDLIENKINETLCPIK